MNKAVTEHDFVEGQQVRVVSVLATDWRDLPRNVAPVLEDNYLVNPNKGSLRLDLQGETGSVHQWHFKAPSGLGRAWYLDVEGYHYPLEQLTVEPVQK